jgi:ADP-ribosylglycohydrolase
VKKTGKIDIALTSVGAEDIHESMLGAIAGDIIGSAYEFGRTKSKEFPLFGRDNAFTDDTVMTVAMAQAVLTDGDYRRAALDFGRRYPGRGYGSSFQGWLAASDPRPYNSYGNGSAMRVSPVGFAFDTVEDVLREAARSAGFSHSHPEGIKGAQATALAILLARKKSDKTRIKEEIASRFGYDLDRTLDEIRPYYRHDESCQRTVPEAILSFLESTSYEDCVRNAVSLGGDADTLACIAGGIAEAFYGPPLPGIVSGVRGILAPELWDIVERFYRTFPSAFGTSGVPDGE